MMKKILLLLTIWNIFLSCSDVSIPKDIDTSVIVNDKRFELDTIYQDAIHSDTTRAVFKSDADQQKVVDAFEGFLKGLGPFLKEHHFTWGEQTKCWHRMYVAEDGTIEYYRYSFKTPIDKEKEEQFKQLLALYIQTHKMPLSADRKFSQCGTAVFADKQ